MQCSIMDKKEWNLQLKFYGKSSRSQWRWLGEFSFGFSSRVY